MKKEDVSWIKGISYIPSYARNFYDAWTYFDAKTVERELHQIREIGFNVVRTWLHYHAYLENPKQQMKNIETFLKLSEKNDLKVIFALFNNDGIEWDLRSPGPYKLGREHWLNYDAYIRDIIGTHRGDSRICVWESMNEPMVGPVLLWLKNKGPKSLESMFKLTGLESIYSLIYDNMIDVFRFVKHCYDLIKEIDPSIPITVGSGDYREIYYLADAQDIISFHTYEANEERLMEIISRAKNAAAEVNKPLLLSEWGSSLYSDPLGYTSGQQADYYKRIMPIVEKAEIGWCIWSFMVGIEPYAFHGLVHINGVERPAVQIIREHLLGENSSNQIAKSNSKTKQEVAL